MTDWRRLERSARRFHQDDDHVASFANCTSVECKFQRDLIRRLRFGKS